MTKRKSRSYVLIIKHPEDPKAYFAGFRVLNSGEVLQIWVHDKKNARIYEDLSVMGPALRKTGGTPSRYYNYE